MRRPFLACLTAITLLASTAGAQPAPAGAGQTPQLATPTVTTPTAVSQIEVHDPLLEPVPPPAHLLGNWREVITQIKARSTDVIIARAEIERFRGLWRQSLAQALPQINAQGTAAYDLARGPSFIVTPATTSVAAVTQSPAAKSLSGSITASVPLFALQTWYAIGTADRQTKATVLAAEDKERVVLGTVADAIVAVVTNERVSEVNRVGLRSSLQTLELTVRKQKLGSGTQLDVVRASQDVSTARATLINGDEGLRKAREALGLALGYNDSWGVTQTVSLDQIGDTLRQICAPAKPEERTDVLAAKANVEVAERGVTGSWLVYAPTITLSSTAVATTEGYIAKLPGGTMTGTTTPVTPQFALGDSRAWSISAVLNVPIWDGGARYGTTRIAKAQQVEANATLNLTTRQAQLQLTQTTRNVQVAQSSRDVAITTRDLAKETARLSQVAFEAGTGTSFDLVTSQALARQAELNLAVQEFSVIQAKIEAMLAAANCKY